MLAELATAGRRARTSWSSCGRCRRSIPARQILCAGANYYQHVRQIVYSTLRLEGDDRPDGGLERGRAPGASAGPAPSRTCSRACRARSPAPSDDVVLWGPGACHDWELELAVVIGAGGAGRARGRAMSYVAGYTISNDISTGTS